jgi:tetratricopeptide (TPR) repeat protein
LASDTSEDEAIKAVILKELEGFSKYDHNTWASQWVQSPKSHYINVSKWGYQHHKGWESFNDDNKEYFEKRRWEDSLFIEKKDFDIQNFGNTALVTYKDKVTFRAGDSENIQNWESSALLVKDSDTWKITLMNSINVTSFEDSLMNSPEYELNSLGYEFLFDNKVNEAIKVFKLNVDLFPESSNVYDSLGEAYMKSGQKELAIKNYEKSLKLDPNNKNAEKMLNELSKK